MAYKLLILLTVFYTAGCSSAAVIGHHGAALKHHILYVVNHGWHAGIIVDAGLAGKYMQTIPPVFSNSRFIEFGWGDERFYRTADISLLLAIRALFWPTDSVLHIKGVPYNPESYYRYSEVEEIPVTESEFKKILRFIDASFERDQLENVIKLGDGDRFYRARGQYHLFNTCNSWVIDALSFAGITGQIFPTLTASGAMCKIRRYHRTDHQVPSRQEAK